MRRIMRKAEVGGKWDGVNGVKDGKQDAERI